ncbi:MAG: HEAT repeat domain-containing protein, partial [Jaaginema sp. PMC 1080.18]|nr:HEAT repeat domain-containing protein [Jaaginema sp. PMC 1080.18]
LGKIGQGNPQAIATLCDLATNAESESTRRWSAESLGKIDPGNPQAIATLCDLAANAEFEFTRGWAAKSLGKIITTDEQRQKAVSTLQPHLNNETYENNFNLYKHYYNILWKIAQDLPYTDFYQAWHKTTQQSLENQLLDLSQQLQTHESKLLLCLDIHSLLTTRDPIEIADLLWQKIHETAFPEATKLPPEISRSSQLTRYLKQLKRDCNKTHLVLILHDSIPPQNSFSPSLRDVLIQCSDTALIAWLTDSPLDPPLKGFLPTQGNLVGALQAWLDEV